MKNFFLVLCLFLIVILFYTCSNSDNPTVVTTTSTTNGGNQPPGTPVDVSPADSSSNVSRSVTVQWSCTDPNSGDTLRFDVYFDSNNPPAIFASNVKKTTEDIAFVYAHTKYYWKIVAKTKQGASTTGPVWWFTTGSSY